MALSADSCMKCGMYLTCREKSKGPSFTCSNFQRIQAASNLFGLGNIQLVPEEGLKRNKNKEPEYDFDTGKPLEVNISHKPTTVDTDLVVPEGEGSYDQVDDSKSNKKLDNFIWTAMRDSYDPHTNTIRDLKIDDRDFKAAVNYYDFCRTTAGKSIKMPFARQLWIAYTLLSDYCPRCTPSKYKNIENIPVDMDPRDLNKKVTMLENGVCPKCNASKGDLVLNNEITDHNQLVLIAGQRAGKSSFTATISAYYLHKYLMAPKLSTVCAGIQEFTPLTFTFIGITASRAIKLLWSPFNELVSASIWFQDYIKMLKHSGAKYDKEFYSSAKLYMRFYHKNIDIYPSSPIKRTLRGDTRILAATDELSWFPYKVIVNDDTEVEEEDERERANADEVHQALENSLTTVRSEVLSLYKKGIHNIPTGMNLNISSPQSEMDKMARLYKECEADGHSLSLGVRLPTWDISPLYSRDHPIIMDAYRKNAQRAERDFGANPPKLSSSVLTLETCLPAFRPLVPNTHRLNYDLTNPNHTSGSIVEVMPRSVWNAQVLALDAGLSNNSFSIILGEKVDTRLLVNAVLEIIPAKGTQIHFTTVYRNVILPLIKNCNVAVVGADRWNSINLLQQITEDTSGLTMVVQKTLNRKNLDAFLAMVNSQTIDLPAIEKPIEYIQSVRNYKIELIHCPVSHLLLQMITVREQQGTYGKGEGYTDDTFRALAMLHALCFHPRVAKKVEERKPKEVALVTGVTRSAVFSASRGFMGGSGGFS